MRGLYASATGMLVQQRCQETIAHNLANLNTPAYKCERVTARSFKEELLWRLGGPTQPRTVGRISSGVKTADAVILGQQGPLKDTGRSLDWALVGEGFWVVETKEGELYYTRNGSLRVNDEGYLVSGWGDYLLGRGGRILIGEGEVTISPHGQVIVDGEERAEIDVVRIAERDLVRLGEDVYRLRQGARVQTAQNWEIKQGFLEGPNVDPSLEITRALEAVRAYETNQRMLQVQDKILEMAANRIGSLN